MNAMSTGNRPYELKARAEAQRETRERIVRATMELHRDVGPARTTVAEIARRAGVQRLTVYNHFPDLGDLLGACQTQWLELHPPPDLSARLTLRDPVQRLQAVLTASYTWFDATAEMAEHVQRDRVAIPELDRLLVRTVDATLGQLADLLASGFPRRGRAASKRRAVIRLALDFWTWHRLRAEGLDDQEAAEAMTAAISGGAVPGS